MTQSVTLSPELAKRMLRVVHHVERTGLSTSNPQRGKGITRANDDVGMYNIDTASVPEGAIVWLYQYRAGDVSYAVKRPEYGGITRFGAAAASLAPSTSGRAWTSGVHKVLCNDYASIAMQSRVSPQPDSWYAEANEIGPILVVGTVPASEQPGGIEAGAGLVLGLLDHWRP